MISFKSYITEGVSPILYHLTDLPKTLSILDRNEFILSSDLGTGADRRYKGKKFKPFFLSTSRVKYGGYTRSWGDDPYGCLVNIVLDGVKLSHNLEGMSLDYWGPEWRKPSMDTHTRLRNDENEDRILSPKGLIEDASKYIKEIHIMLGKDNIKNIKDRSAKLNDQDQDRVWKDIKTIGKITDLCHIYEIPYYIYDDFKAFQVQNKSKGIKGFERNPYRNKIASLNELFTKNEISELSDAAQTVRYNMLYHNWNGDFVSGLDCDVHNMSKGYEIIQKRSLHTLVMFMHKYKLRNTTQVVEFLSNKWRDKKE